MDIKQKFVSEGELSDRKKRRQEEWEKTRTSEQPLECPEESYDNRSLYDRLSEQKQKKDDEYEEKHRFSNQVQGLQEDEAAFLDHVSHRQMEIEQERLKEEQQIFKQIKENAVSANAVMKPTKKAPSTVQENRHKSQNALLSGAVKRKSTLTKDDCDKSQKMSADDIANSKDNLELKEVAGASSTDLDEKPISSPQLEADDGTDSDNHPDLVVRPAAHVPIGVLPGISYYGNSSDSTNSDSSNSEPEEVIPTRSVRPRAQQIIEHY